MSKIIALLIASLVISCVYSAKGKVKKEATLDLTPQEQEYFLAKFEYFHYLKTNKFAKAFIKAFKNAADYDKKHGSSKQEMELINSNGGCYKMEQLNSKESKFSNKLREAQSRLDEQVEYWELQEQILEYSKGLSEEEKLKIENIFEANEQNVYKGKITAQLKQMKKDGHLIQQKIEERRLSRGDEEKCNLSIHERVQRSRKESMIGGNLPYLISIDSPPVKAPKIKIPRKRAGAMVFNVNAIGNQPLGEVNRTIYFF